MIREVVIVDGWFRDHTDMIREVVIVEGWFQRSHRYDKRGSHC